VSANITKGSFCDYKIREAVNRSVLSDGCVNIFRGDIIAALLNLGHSDSQSEKMKVGAVNPLSTNCQFTNRRTKKHQNLGCLCVKVADYMQLQPHVLSTPVIEDFNSDGVTEELLLPVSYYLDDFVDDDT